MFTDSPIEFKLLPEDRTKMRGQFLFFVLLGVAGLVSGSLIPVIVMLAATVLHELGHYVGFRWYGVSVDEVLLTPVSGHVEAEEDEWELPPREKFVVAFAGPLAGFIPLVPLLAFRSSLSNIVVIVSLLLLTHNAIQLVPVTKGVDGHFMLDAVVEWVRGEALGEDELVGTLYWKLFVYGVMGSLAFLVGFRFPI